MLKTDFDAIVIGAGPNGLAAAIKLQQHGLSVLIIEGKNTIGGGLRTEELTLPGYFHDICSAVHPLAYASPFFKMLPLNKHGLDYVFPKFSAAHPFDNGTSAILGSFQETASRLGSDKSKYADLIQPIIDDWPHLIGDILAPLLWPKNPIGMAKFGLKGMVSATYTSKRFSNFQTKGLWAGMAAHSMQPLSNLTTSAIALTLMALGHISGWPIPKGGSKSIANALESYFISIGGKIQTGEYVQSLKDLPSFKAVLLDVTPKQLLQIAGYKFSSIYKWQLRKYEYGMGVYKVDFALDDKIPFSVKDCSYAGTVHLGNTYEEIAFSEYQITKGKYPANPFTLIGQQSIFDNTRAPAGKHTAWAYCHVPNGSTTDLTQTIENQIERFAPGFKERILAKHTYNTLELEEYNPNYIGGDINGGKLNISQLFTRPALRYSPYRTSAKGIYICSSSTPPGGGVHGMCGYHAAKQVIKDFF